MILLNKRFWRALVSDESGVTTVEYGLIAAFIATACIVAMTSLGGTLQIMYSAISTAVVAAS